jgi:7-cyano-7-deazaguanine synthase in queuosine biosynthesis
MAKAVVLLSGGLDSATTLAIARSENYACHCLTVDYAQRHRAELAAAARVAQALGVDYTLTVSCYQASPEGRACGRCESSCLRREGFASAGLPDPTCYLSRR